MHLRRAIAERFRDDPLGFSALIVFYVTFFATWLACSLAFGLAGFVLGWIPAWFIGQVVTLFTPIIAPLAVLLVGTSLIAGAVVLLMVLVRLIR